MVLYDTTGASHCIQGTGYTGISLAGIIKVWVTTNVNAGWFLWYYNGNPGQFCSLGKNQSVTFPLEGVSRVLVTQVDPGASHGGSNCG